MSSQKTNLLITSGDGPRECRLAVTRAVLQMQKEAQAMKIEASVSFEKGDVVLSDQCELASALVTLEGAHTSNFIKSWVGTVQWVHTSPFRPDHKRRNWFIGIFELEASDGEAIVINPNDVRFETFRAGGAGGQHQNTTDSAVRAVHMPTGVTAISRDERSQHRNKKIAMDRLKGQMLLAAHMKMERERANTNKLHKQLERGNPVRKFMGKKFDPV